MKINVKVDLGALYSEEGETSQESITQDIWNKVSESVSNQLSNQAKEEIINQVRVQVSAYIDDFLAHGRLTPEVPMETIVIELIDNGMMAQDKLQQLFGGEK